MSIPDQASITLPPGSSWNSGSHWHEIHTEYLKIEAGAARTVLGGIFKGPVRPSDGVVTVPRGTIHEWHRSEGDDLDSELVVTEWTMPSDGQKEIFFRNIDGLVLNTHHWIDVKYWREQALLEDIEVEIRLLGWKMDNFPIVLNGRWPAVVRRVATYFALLWTIAYACFEDMTASRGLKGLHKQYTPPSLRERLPEQLS